MAIEGLAATVRSDDGEPLEDSATPELLVIQEALLRADRAFREALAATTIFAVIQEKKRLRLRSAANGECCPKASGFFPDYLKVGSVDGDRRTTGIKPNSDCISRRSHTLDNAESSADLRAS